MTDISQISKKLLAANRQVLIDAGLDPDSPYLPQSEASKAKVGVKAEKLLQRECEDWLHHRGYWRRTSTWIMADKKPPMGWQFHLHNARGNPQLLDILLLGNDGRYFECELKKADGKWTSKEQEQLCTFHEYPMVRMFVDFVALVIEWDGQPLVAPVRQVEHIEEV